MVRDRDLRLVPDHAARAKDRITAAVDKGLQEVLAIPRFAAGKDGILGTVQS